MTNQSASPRYSAEPPKEKLITVCVAAYNGESTLSKALDSCLISDMAQLEVIIVDDGSTDQTAILARKYIAMRPDTFRLIQQPNGGYGSAIMTGLHNARGRYFRTLDCDDWFDKAALEQLLQYLKICSTDVVFTNYCTVQNDQVQRIFEVCNGFQAESTYTVDMLEQHELDMEIHGMTFHTEMLCNTGMSLPHHCRYTDMAYTFIGMSAAQTVSFLPVTLYYYRLGRDGQSVSLENYQKHFDDYAKVTEQVLRHADEQPNSIKGNLLRNRARDIAQHGIELQLRFSPSSEVKKRLVAYDKSLRTHHPDIAHRMTNKNIRLLRASGYMMYRIAQRHAQKKIELQE